MATKTLLQKAKEIKTHKHVGNAIGEEEIELGIAWLTDEITLSQLSGALGFPTIGGARCYNRIAIILREAYRTGLIKVR